MKRFLLLALSVLFIFPSQTSISQKAGYYPKGGPDMGVEDVSLIQLIANPQAFDNKRVRITGYLRLEFEGNVVYLHREDYEYGLTKNGLWVDVPSDMTQQQRRAVNNQYVICTGTFRASMHGHMGLNSGEITEITRLESWLQRPRSQSPDSLVPPPPPPPPAH